MIERYLAGVKNVFTRGRWGEDAPEAYDATIQGTDTVLRSWSDHLTGPLRTVHLVHRRQPLPGRDAPDRQGARVTSCPTSATRTLQHHSRRGCPGPANTDRLFNRKWIEGMMKEGYAGADQVSVMVSNGMGWAIMRPGSVPDDTWDEIDAVFVRDKLGLSIREWFEAENPLRSRT